LASVAEFTPVADDRQRSVIGLDPGQLDAPPVADPPYSAYTPFAGLTQHDLYHAGQIALLKRALAGRVTSA
jgi:hypothetical protein